MDPGKNEDDGSKFLAWIRRSSASLLVLALLLDLELTPQFVGTTEKQGRKSAREKEVTWEFIESMFKDVSLLMLLTTRRELTFLSSQPLFGAVSSDSSPSLPRIIFSIPSLQPSLLIIESFLLRNVTVWRSTKVSRVVSSPFPWPPRRRLGFKS